MPEYLDMAATTPVSPRVAEVVMHYMCEEFGNAGSRTHQWGNRAKKAVGAAREEIASHFGVKPDEVVFTSGATESDNMAILGLEEHGRATGRMHIVTSATEHKAVLEPAERLASRGFDVEFLKPNTTGRFEADEILDRVRPDTLLVSLMHVNNETGVIQPIAEIADTLVETDTYCHVDAAQSYTKVELDAVKAPIDLISISGHKIGAPKGVGALVARRRKWSRVPLVPLMVGGGQERGLRPGTLPVALIAGLAEATRERSEGHEVWMSDTLRKREEILSWLKKRGGEINGHPVHTAPQIANASFAGRDAEALLLEIQDQFAVATGSACTSASYKPSHALSAMGLDQARVLSALRFSW